MQKFFLLVLSVWMWGCGGAMSVEPAGRGGQGTQATPVAPDTKLDWEFIRQTVIPVCLQCHSGTQSPTLNEYGKVVARLDDVQTEVSGGTMPPPEDGYSPLDACQQASLRQWAANGAPQTSDFLVAQLPECASAAPSPTDPPTSTPPPSTPPALTYDNLVKNILQPYCISCHNANGSGDAKLILFYPYSEFEKGIRRWKAPGNTSKIVKIVTKTGSGRMPPLSTGNGLSNDEVDFIVRWIDAGYPK